MLTLVDKLALYFHKKECDKGDVVGIFMTNRPDYIALVLAFSRLGTVACLFNTHLKQKMLLKRIEGINCKALIVSRDLISSRCTKSRVASVNAFFVFSSYRRC